MPKYKEERGALAQHLVEMWMSVMVSSTSQRSHLWQLKRSQRGQKLVTQSGLNKNIMDSVKDGPFRKHTAIGFNAKLSPKRSSKAKQTPCRKYYMPSNDTKTFQINSKGHLQCLQDPNFIHKTNVKGKLPGSRKAPIYNEPGTVSCKTLDDLNKLYPNSFDRLSSLKGEYNIWVDPTVKPAIHARRKVPIESKEAIDKELDYLIEEEIIMEQVEPTPWVSSVTFPMKPNGEVRVCLDPSNLNKAIIWEHHKPMTVEEIVHELAGATIYTKANALKAFLQIHVTQKASLLTTFNSHCWWLRCQRTPFWAKMRQDVFQLCMDAILEQCQGVTQIHDDMVIFGVDQEDHNANLFNLLNVCQKEGLVLNSKKLELWREESHLLHSWLQCPGHASRPEEGPRDHKDDSTNRQAAASVFSRYGKLHRDLHSKPVTSHGAASGNA